jgi:hypothetical protein
MSEEIVYSNLTVKTSCPDGYYTVNGRCCTTPNCSGYGIGVNPRSGSSECCEPLPPSFKIISPELARYFNFSCSDMSWKPAYCDYVTIAYPTIEECNQKLSEAQTWFATNGNCSDRDVSGCIPLTGGFPLDDGLNPPPMPTQEEIDLYYCPPPSGP